MPAHPEVLLSPWFIGRDLPVPQQPGNPERDALREAVAQRLAQRLGILGPLRPYDGPTAPSSPSPPPSAPGSAAGSPAGPSVPGGRA